MKMTDKMFEPLDDYEREIIEAIENDEYEPVPISKQEPFECSFNTDFKSHESSLGSYISIISR